jgi:hypothetical protein
VKSKALATERRFIKQPFYPTIPYGKLTPDNG